MGALVRLRNTSKRFASVGHLHHHFEVPAGATMAAILDNPNPTIFKPKQETVRDPSTALWLNSFDDLDGAGRADDESEHEDIDSNEIYGLRQAHYPVHES